MIQQRYIQSVDKGLMQNVPIIKIVHTIKTSSITSDYIINRTMYIEFTTYSININKNIILMSPSST